VGRTFTLFAGCHSGYERLPEPVRHRRFVFHLNGNLWLVRDVAEGKGSHLLETSWHFAPEVEVSRRGNNFIATSPSDGRDASKRVALLPVGDPRWNSELVSEHVSPAYGVKVSAPVARYSARVGLPAEHAVVLLASDVEKEETGTFTREERHSERNTGPEAAYRYDDGSVSHWMIFDRRPRGIWHFGPWTSNAKFLYFCLRDQRVDHLVLCDGRFAQVGDNALFSHDATLQSLEWRKRDGQQQLFCPDEDAARSFSGSVLDSELVI
jgi:hypothetical protein